MGEGVQFTHGQQRALQRVGGLGSPLRGLDHLRDRPCWAGHRLDSLNNLLQTTK